MNGARTSSYIKGRPVVHPKKKKKKIYHKVLTNFIFSTLWNTKEDILKKVPVVLVHTMKVNCIQMNIESY